MNPPRPTTAASSRLWRTILSLSVAGGIASFTTLFGNPLSSPDATASAAPLQVYILAGQSNMVGIADINELPDELRKPDEKVRIYAGGWVDSQFALRWEALQPGFGASKIRFGPELTFGRGLQAANPGCQIALIKWAWGGVNLENDWNPATGWCYQGGTNPMTGKNVSPGFKATVTEQLAVLRKEHPDLEVAGMIWMQGESDSLKPGMAEHYAANLENFITTVRRDLALPDLPFVLGRIPDIPEWIHRAAVRKAQADVAAKVPNTVMIDTDTLPHWPSKVLKDSHGLNVLHYNSEGQMMLGTSFAEAIRSFAEAKTGHAQ